jgi:anti-sigma28 factor (negative regulator of flagellin synthesis)
MEIRNNAEALKAFLGVSSSTSAKAPQIRGNEAVAGHTAFAGDQATLSYAGTEILHSAADASVRDDKVRAIQGALAAGSYSVEASAVAGKVIDAMLGGSFGSGN